MGLWSTSKSASTTNTTANYSTFSDLNDSVALSLMGSGHNVSLLDGGAIKNAFDFATASNNASLDLVKTINSSTSRTLADSISAVSESARSESENVVLQLQRTAFYALLAWGAVSIINNARKG